MRLLLLLSAFLSALTGVAGSRGATVQPVTATASIAEQSARSQARRAVTAATYTTLPGIATAKGDRLALVGLSLFPAVPLYADRRRE